MHLPDEFYQLEKTIAKYLSELRPAQRTGLCLWVMGAVLAQSACQNAVITALLAYGGFHTLRQYLREWLYDGADRAAPCSVQLEVSRCFAPLLRWLLSWWQGKEIALAIDATTHHDKLTALVVSVLYEGCAIPVAWHIMPGEQPGEWLGPIVQMLHKIQDVIPPSWRVIVLADRGLWSPCIWHEIRECRFHPVMRIQNHSVFQPRGQQIVPAKSLVKPGTAWTGRGRAFSDSRSRLEATLMMLWGEGQQEPWAVLTDLAPEDVGVCWYGLRIWIELGFRAFKGLGWQWERTRRVDPERVSRHWLVMAVATLWVLAYGTRMEEQVEDRTIRKAMEDAMKQWPGSADSTSQNTPMPRSEQRDRRQVSLFRLGLLTFARQILRGRPWKRLFLYPEPWPEAMPGVQFLTRAPPDNELTRRPYLPL